MLPGKRLPIRLPGIHRRAHVEDSDPYDHEELRPIYSPAGSFFFSQLIMGRLETPSGHRPSFRCTYPKYSVQVCLVKCE